MAENVTVAQIKLRALRRADKEGTNFVGADELLDYVNEAYASLYSLMVSTYQNYFSKDQNLTLTAGVDTYDLPADFYKAISFDFLNGTRYETIYPYDELERNAALSTAQSIPGGTVKLRYIAAPTVFAADTDMVNCVAGWESLLVTDIAIMILDKEESDTDRLERRRSRDFKRIEEAAQNRSVTFPGRVTDVTIYNHLWFGDTLRYRLYGDAVQFINQTWTGVTQ